MQQSILIRMLYNDGVPLWRNVRVLRATAQVVSALVILSIVFLLVDNMLDAASRRGLDFGLGFLEGTAGFPISESVIEYQESDSYLYAFFIGILNTLKVALLGIVLATMLGAVIGVARLSSNWLVSRLAGAYVEFFRNVPLLVQIFFWYFGIFQALPRVQNSISWPGPVYLSNRGVFIIWADPTAAFWQWLLYVAAGLLLAGLAYYVLTRLQESRGWPTHPLLSAAALFVLLCALGWVLLPQSPLAKDVPVLGRFNFSGGTRLTPEFAALLVALVVYTAAFIAEIVRAGIQSVQRGQVEAARALGLSGLQSLQLVVFPQALRVVIPPLISQYLNLTKNSSLAIAIGFADLFSVGRIMINQAGRAIPVFLLIMATYLILSLTYSLIGNLYNRHIRVVER